ncbi:MAG: class I adenylate-forming enzyme family protein [Schumannella sp.]
MPSDLLGLVLAAADAHPGDPALTYGRRTLGYGELAARIRATAAGLRAEGLVPGDRVLFSVRPGADAVVLALGIVLAGGVVVFADPGAGEALFRARAALAAPRFVAAESLLHLASSRPLRGVARRRGLELAPYGRLVPGATHLYAGPWLPGVPRGALPLRALRSRARGESTRIGESGAGAAAEARTLGGAALDGAALGGAALGEPALIVFTSGTTDSPKGVVHSRASLGAGLADFAAGVGIRRGQRVLTDQLMVGVPALIAGAHWSIPPAGIDPGARPERYLRLLPDAELLFAVPAGLDAILRELDARPQLAPEHLDTIVLGGAPVLRPLLERAAARFPWARIRAVYGMTEILPVAIADGAEKLAAPPGEGDDVGRVVPSVRARIRDGELVLSGDGLALGYLGGEGTGIDPLSEIATGDLARLDGDRLTLLGRRKDMFIRGTQNVYPGLYEPVIAGLPGVAEAAITGLPDAIGDDRIVLALVAAGDPAGLAERVRRSLPGLIDAGVLPDEIIVLDELPRSGRGRKLDRTRLAEVVGGALGESA